ncbi:Beta-L-arabinobiosidase [termite gut metagenome]|uniref:Beta-L-arabinobiosidase n=1 Tax=termite gut metagenome TaxID=433724 RepID=A0A5J4PWH5_9ZZZZ
MKELINTRLWDKEAGFYKVIPKNGKGEFSPVREQHGYTPWYFHIAPDSYANAWMQLLDKEDFWAPFGPTTVEQRAPGFDISYEGHECKWNGSSWPFSTTITLVGLANLLNDHPSPPLSAKDYLNLLTLYSRSHSLQKEDGTIIPWIDENLNPYNGDWISRTRLKTWENNTWDASKGGVERGKDYNHSTFCDLVISGLIGIRPQEGNQLTVNPLIPADTWDYFCIDNVLYHGKKITVIYDKTGKKYGKGKGLIVLVNGKKIASSPDLSVITCKLK